MMPRRMARLVRILLIVAGVLAFLAVSGLIARVLAAAGAERAAAVDVVRAQARGDVAEVLGTVKGCRAQPRCRARMRAQVVGLRTRGQMHVLRVDEPPRLVFGSRTSTTRIAWRAGTRLPVVQCVRVRRRGDGLSGFTVDVVALSPPIARAADCWI